MTVIGIATCRKLEDYRQSILHAGGDPRILDGSMAIEQALSGIGGLMLTGGDDVAPSRYGEAAHATVVAAEAGRDEFEAALIAAARARNLPIFAICRGVQILNEERVDRKRWRAAGVAYVRAQLTRALDLMGIDVPNRM